MFSVFVFSAASSLGFKDKSHLIPNYQAPIGFGFNFNLSRRISLKVSYIYDAAGRKLRKATSSETRNYIGGIEYVGVGSSATIDFIHTQSGIARRSGSTYVDEFILRDHLGNARIVHNSSGTVLQEMDYHPFGLEIARKVTAPKLEYTYNGKEWQPEVGQFDYGARLYDPVVGRWNVVDPLAEQMRRWSPYSYGFNNPIRFIDPDGRRPVRFDPPSVVKNFRASLMNLLSGQSGSGANSSISNVDNRTAAINRTIGVAEDVQAIGEGAAYIGKVASAKGGEVLEGAGAALTIAGYVAAPFTEGASLALIPVGTAVEGVGLGMQAPKMVADGEYGRIGYEFGSAIIFRAGGIIVDQAQLVGKITKTDNSILNLVNEMWNKTAEFIYNHTQKSKEEEERETNHK